MNTGPEGRLIESHLSKLANLISQVGPIVTEISLAQMRGQMSAIRGSDKRSLANLGITLNGRDDCIVLATDPGVSLGAITIHNHGAANLFLVGNSGAPRSFVINMRIVGSSCTVAFPEPPLHNLTLPEIFLRSSGQVIFWGRRATSVWSKVELEGDGSYLVVGDDCMFSAGIWIRNHDMHTVFDAATGTVLNDRPTNIVFEQHVWAAFESMILGANRVGYGSIIGARSIVKDVVAPKTLVAGIPARLIRNGVSWDRSAQMVAPQTREYLARLDSYYASVNRG
jgi:carbonic anhydrase/acetyltransferase-like protein (isoleucine patch superfamily)